MNPRRIPPLVALAVIAVCLGGCQAVQDARATVDRTKDCASLVSEITGLDLRPDASAREVARAADKLEQAVDRLGSSDVKSAASVLAGDLRRLEKVIADKAGAGEVNKTLQQVGKSAENLARTCEVPVDQVFGG